MTEKGPAAFRTISEASDEVGVASHVLRFWESRFSFIRPMKRAGGRRFYRPQDLEVLKGVRALLHDEGYTIKGVQKLHKEGGVARLLEAGETGAPPAGAPPADAPAPARPTLPVEDDGQIDLFAEPPPCAPPPPAAPHAPEAARRYVLEAPARARLETVLADLEAVRTAIDGLLGAPSQDA